MDRMTSYMYSRRYQVCMYVCIVCTTYKQVKLAGRSFFQLIFFSFSNFLLLLLQIQDKGSIVRFSFVVE